MLFRSRRETLGFFFFSGVALVIENGILAVSHYALDFTSPLSDNIAKNVVGLGVGTLFRFWAYRNWVFRDRNGPAASASVGRFRLRRAGRLPAQEQREDRRVLLK